MPVSEPSVDKLVNDTVATLLHIHAVMTLHASVLSPLVSMRRAMVLLSRRER